MKRSTAKEKILITARKMIEEKGYANTNINDVAHVADVSIGTLYYHFPKGKLSILPELTNITVTNFLENLKTEEFYKDPNISSFDEGLKAYFLAIINLHRKDRQFLAAMESEMLSNIDYYIQSMQGLEQGLFEKEFNLFLKPIKTLIKQFPEEKLSIVGKEIQIHKLIDCLIHRHVYYQYTFGSDEEFSNTLIKIFHALSTIQ